MHYLWFIFFPPLPFCPTVLRTKFSSILWGIWPQQDPSGNISWAFSSSRDLRFFGPFGPASLGSPVWLIPRALLVAEFNVVKFVVADCTARPFSTPFVTKRVLSPKLAVVGTPGFALGMTDMVLGIKPMAWDGCTAIDKKVLWLETFGVSAGE